MPPYPEWIDEDSGPYQLTPLNSRRIKGVLLPGSQVSKLDSKGGELVVQNWESGLYQIGCRLFKFMKNRVLGVKEKVGGLRLEAVLSGELHISNESGELASLQQGQYHITGIPQYLASFDPKGNCTCFVSYYSNELIRDFGVTGHLQPAAPKPMPESMIQLIQDALHHPHHGMVQEIYYRKLVSELLYIHLTCSSPKLPADLTEADIAAVHEADAILSTDLSAHYTIQQLSGMAGTNAFTLKKGFRLVFKMGVFGRLLFRRMEQAKVLLETTSKPIKEVAYEAGYDTVAGFITAFRKRFGKTPLDWRESRRNDGD